MPRSTASVLTENLDNIVQPFQVETLELRGQYVRMGTLLDTIVRRHDYPLPVAKILAEALCLSACLASSMKFRGKFTLQTQSDGALPMIVCDITDDGILRGYAQINRDKLDALRRDHNIPDDATISVPRLMGQGYLAFTVDSELLPERYQGIVELAGEALSDCVHHYFKQSEQIDTVLKVSAATIGDDHQSWRGGALLMQRLPPKDGLSKEARETLDDDWRRAVIFLSSSTPAEILDPALTAPQLLYRLFHEDGVRIYDPLHLKDARGLDRDHVEHLLRALSDEDIDDMMLDDKISVTCQFTKDTLVYTRADIAALRAVK